MSRILAVDGGGIRGIVSARILLHLQAELAKPLHDCFDVFAGTSTGSLIAAGLACGKECDELHSLYELNGAGIFSKRRWGWLGSFASWWEAKYELTHLQEVLESKLKGITFREIREKYRKRLIIPTFDIENHEPLIFDSHADTGRFDNTSLLDACCASCAAPTYFPVRSLKLGGVTYHLVDGGVTANDPGATALAQVGSIGGACVVSIGTGKQEPKGDDAPQDAGKLRWANLIIDVLFHGSGGATEGVLRGLLQKRYQRIQVRLPRELCGLDNASRKNVRKIDQRTDAWCQGAEGKAAIKAVSAMFNAPQSSLLQVTSDRINKLIAALGSAKLTTTPDGHYELAVEGLADVVQGGETEIKNFLDQDLPQILRLSSVARTEIQSLRERLSPDEWEYLLDVIRAPGEL